MDNKTGNGNVSPEAPVFRVPDENEKINQHPWKLSREDCVLNILKNRNLRHVADIGVNDMYYTKKLKTFAGGKVYAVDVIFPEEETVRDDIICLNDIGKLPDAELDCVVMMDVLEHVENDALFFGVVVNKLKTNGTVLITVPAWQFLFSAYDTASLHYRRYNRKQLMALLKRDDVKIERCHYFYISAFLMRLLFLYKKGKSVANDINWKYSAENIITIIAKTALNIDFLLNKILDKVWIHLPGLSLLAVCKKI
ncbi:MAG: class I SAM-dependent methyltransferase [Gracilibacteraceae bacterium]|nr:class I SAM-dependent methyltransferase [Gracilibacteraceae bacterium]